MPKIIWKNFINIKLKRILSSARITFIIRNLQIHTRYPFTFYSKF